MTHYFYPVADDGRLFVDFTREEVVGLW